MKLNIIDFRNQYLDQSLCRESSSNPIISTLLPAPEESLLPNSIEAALSLYFINTDNLDEQIKIIIEVNQWVSQSEAIKKLKHTFNLIENFFIKNESSMPKCELALFEETQFFYIDAKKR